MNNNAFLEVIRESFITYLNIDTSRSPAKLKILHGMIAKDLQELYGNDFVIKSIGFNDDKECKIEGRYYPKNVDITILKDDKPIAGYSVKFVMRNYSQNSNNYFEIMLGKTANLRSNDIPYFQIVILFDKIPYYKASGRFGHYEEISEKNISKYIVLSKDNPDRFFHTPDKTLIILLHLKDKIPSTIFEDSTEYADYYLNEFKKEDEMMNVNDENKILQYSNKIKDDFDATVIYNDYKDFIERTHYIVLGKLKK